MKTLKVMGSIMVLAFMALTSCTKISTVITNDGGADFRVENVTTGEYVENRGLAISIGCQPDALEVKPGDNLVLKYIPQSRIGEYDLNVYFNICGMYTLKTEAPYCESIEVGCLEPGLHYIKCKVEYSNGNTEIYESGGVWVYVK